MKATPCECEREGWCTRHNCWKEGVLQRICQCNVDFFNLWEAGKGPGQTEGQVVAHKRIGPCTFRKQLMEERPCITCLGNVRIKVFGCQKVFECTLMPSFEEVAACSTCDLHEAAETPAPA